MVVNVIQLSAKIQPQSRSKMQIHVHADVQDADDFDNVIASISKIDIVFVEKGFTISSANAIY